MINSLPASQLLAVLASLPDPVFLLTRSGRYAAIFGGTDACYYHDGSRLVGKSLRDVLKPAKADWFLSEIARVLAEGGLQIIEYALSGGDILGLDERGPSDLIWFEGRVQKLNFQINDEDAVLWVASNITHRINIESQLSDAMRREREAIDILWRRIASARTESVETHWAINVAQARLTCSKGNSIDLTANEVLLLICLAEAEGTVVSKDLLCARMFPGEETSEHEKINVALSRLRQKLKKKQCDLVVRSVFGRGLVLMQKVRVVYSGRS